MTALADVQVVPLRRIPDERGTIFHMLRRSDRPLPRVRRDLLHDDLSDVVKGWHKHREMTLNYACVHGRIKLVLYDDREGSATCGELDEIFLGPDNYALVVIPPGVWTGFKGMTDPYAIVANCCTHEHDPSRSTRLDPFSGEIPYDWAVKHS